MQQARIIQFSSKWMVSYTILPNFTICTLTLKFQVFNSKLYLGSPSNTSSAQKTMGFVSNFSVYLIAISTSELIPLISWQLVILIFYPFYALSFLGEKELLNCCYTCFQSHYNLSLVLFLRATGVSPRKDVSLVVRVGISNSQTTFSIQQGNFNKGHLRSFFCSFFRALCVKHFA